MADTDARHAPVLRSGEVVLRPFAPPDADALRSILAEPSVARWWGPGEPGVDALDGWQAIDDDTVQWVIEVEGVVAGGIQAAEEADPDYRHASIDVFLGGAHQGHGYGRTAIRLVARWLFEEREHHRLTIDPAAANRRAVHVYGSIGFRPVGVMRRYERGPDGTWHDSLLMDLLREEFVDPVPR